MCYMLNHLVQAYIYVEHIFIILRYKIMINDQNNNKKNYFKYLSLLLIEF